MYSSTSDITKDAFRGADRARSLRALWRRWRVDVRGAAAVELAVVLPITLMFLSLTFFASQGFEIQRKVTLVMRTLTDLTAQQTNIGTSSSTYTYSQILGAASLVIAPYDPSQLSMVLSEVRTDGTTSAKVVWSKANANGAALAVGSTVAILASMANAGYLIQGTVSYVYNPLNIYMTISPITLSNSIFLSPRAASNVSCCS